MDSFMSVRDADRFIEKTTEDLTLLMLAARDENLESCLFLLEKGESAEARTKFGVTLLHFAALNDENGIEIIRHLVNQKKLDLKEEDVDGEEAIFYAVRKANFKVAQALLELQGVETKNLLHFVITRNRGDAAPTVHAWNPDLIKQVDSDKRNALHLAAEYSDLNVCKWLIGEGIEVASKCVYGTALSRAALNKRHGEELVPFFHAQGLNLNETSEVGCSPLHAALAVENIEVAQEMISLGASLQKHNYLFYCVMGNKLNSAKFVNGLDNTQITSRDKDGRTALHVAAERADRVMCKWLIESGIPIYSTCSRWKSSAMHHAVFNKRHGPSLVRYFFESGLNVNKKDKVMYTPIVHAVRSKNFEVAEELLSLGADLRWEKKGVNVLHHCIMSNNLEGAKFVHSKDPGLIKELGKEGMNALHFAAAHADLKMCEWLYEENVDVQASSEKQRNNVLHFVACNKEHGKSLVAFFESKAVNVNKRNKSSLTPLHAALLNENIEVVGELLKVGADIFVKLENDNILHFCILREKFLSAKFVVRINRELLREETNGGMTALHLAARVADVDFCKFLVKKGANFRAKDQKNRSVSDMVPRGSSDKGKYFRSSDTVGEKNSLSIGEQQEMSRFVEKTTEGLTPLMVAARDKDLLSCLEILIKEESVDAESPFGASLFHFAALNEEHGVEIVRHLIHSEGLDIKKTDVDGEEAIFYAVRKGNFRVAKVLLEMRDAETNNLLHFVIIHQRSEFVPSVHAWNPELIKETDLVSRNALHLAAEYADLITCKWLIGHGIDVASKSYFGTALHLASLNKIHGQELVIYFASQNLDLNEKSESGFRPVHAALALENIAVAEELLRLGAKLPITTIENPLLFSVFCNKIKSAQFVFNRKNSLIHGLDVDGKNALHIAGEAADKEMCEWLIDLGILAHSLCLKRHSTFFHLVGLNKEHGVQLVRYSFFRLRLNINGLDKSGYTPLIYALRAKNFVVAEEMLKLGANLHWQKNETNLFHVCVTDNNLEGAKFVHSKDQSLMRKLGKDGMNALHLAANHADLRMCRWLCEENLDVLALSGVLQNNVLHYAALNVHYGNKLVPFFVEKAVNINERNRSAWTPLHAALSKENISVAEELLEAGADIDVKLNSGNVLHFCVHLNKCSSVVFLVGEKKELIKETTAGGVTPLHLAAKIANLKLCKYLVSHGAHVHARDNLKRTALDLVPEARDEDLKNCLNLLEKGENAEAETIFGATLLHFAALNEDHGIEIIWYFVNEKKLDFKKKDQDGEEAIFYAIKKCNFRIAQMLLEMWRAETDNLLHFVITQQRSDVAPLVHAWNPNLINEVDSVKRNALHLAAEYADLNFCQWLVKEGIEVASASPFMGTALHRAPLNTLHGREMVEYFVSEGLDVNAGIKLTGVTPLQGALCLGNLEVAAELLKHDAVLNNKKGGINNMLFFCVLINQLKSAKFVHEMDNSLIREIYPGGRTALHLAAEEADEHMCQWLLENKIGIDYLTPSGRGSILHHVAKNKDFGAQLVHFSFNLGLDMNCQDKKNNTPLMLALRAGNFAVAQELLDHGATLDVTIDGMNILHFCIADNNLEGAIFVHSKSQSLVQEGGEEGMNALHIAAAHADLRMCEWLCRESSVDLCALSGEMENSVLHYAVYNLEHGVDLVDFFVTKGVNVNGRNIFSKTAFHLALSTENINIAEALLSSGANINISLDHDNVLHYCARRNKLLSAKFVVGVEKELVREMTLSDMSALHLAAQAASLEFCKFLVENGANFLVMNEFNQSVLAMVPRDRKDKKKYFRSLGIKK
ncbi:serine/threonine-protein phosphatase 6 regulatory ankyrin repeat subunit C-like [Cloeon dipterum]|uniref:serine/threonine-protein phosphatase 6 regulatory ankyrin repeat subunit C-like n=1 Tax=Cloeon dipterum TaxID=197152 RepID=UPI00321F8AB3